MKMTPCPGDRPLPADIREQLAHPPRADDGDDGHCFHEEQAGQVPPGMIKMLTLYNERRGGFRSICMGTYVWVPVDDVCKLTRFDQRVVVQLAGMKRTLSIPNANIFNTAESEGMETYIRQDAVQ